MPSPGLEPLESRRHFSVTVGLDPAFGTVYTPFGNAGGIPDTGVVLPGGRLLVYGTTPYNGVTGEQHNLFALYSRTGTLVASFNHHHALVQDAATTKALGLVSALTALPDGSVLVEADSGVHRLRLDGTFDPNFGNGGVLPKHARTAQVQPDGTIRAIQTVYDPYARSPESRLLTFNGEGRYLAATDVVPGDPIPLSPGRYLNSTDASWRGTVSVLGADLHPDATFGTDGTVDLTGAINRWSYKHGPWYRGTQKLNGLPSFLTDPDPEPLVGGGYAVRYEAYATHAPTRTPGPAVVRYVRLDANGGIVATGVTADTFRVAGTQYPQTFDSGRHTWTAAFDTGAAVSAVMPWTMGNSFAQVEAADGSYYVFGQADPGNGSGFAIVHTLPLVGSISGTAFGDTNANQKRDLNEAPAGGRTVFIDVNDNGRLDPGENRTTTDANGDYAFDDLGPGTYVVRRVLPTGYAVTTATNPITLAAGQHATVLIGTRATQAGPA